MQSICPSDEQLLGKLLPNGIYAIRLETINWQTMIALSI